MRYEPNLPSESMVNFILKVHWQFKFSNVQFAATTTSHWQCQPQAYSESRWTQNLMQCTPCPPGRTTGGRKGALALRDCGCAVGAMNETMCVGCDAGQYFYDGGCMRCPSGTDSPPNSLGPYSCMCPPGSFADVKSACVPCRMGTYSHALSAVCSPCPPGFTTDRTGATSLLACRPSSFS